MKIFILVMLSLVPSLAAEKLTSIELSDQFGKVHQIQFPTDRPIVLTATDLKGSDALPAWLTALKEHYSTNVIFVGVADVRSAPAPLRSFVRSRFKKKYSYPVLLDWNGSILDQLAPKEAVPNIYFLSTSGKLEQHLSGPFSKERLAALRPAFTPAALPDNK